MLFEYDNIQSFLIGAPNWFTFVTPLTLCARYRQRAPYQTVLIKSCCCLYGASESCQESNCLGTCSLKGYINWDTYVNITVISSGRSDKGACLYSKRHEWTPLAKLAETPQKTGPSRRMNGVKMTGLTGSFESQLILQNTIVRWFFILIFGLPCWWTVSGYTFHNLVLILLWNGRRNKLILVSRGKRGQLSVAVRSPGLQRPSVRVCQKKGEIENAARENLIQKSSRSPTKGSVVSY